MPTASFDTTCEDVGIFFSVLEVRPTALHVLNKRSTIVLIPSIFSLTLYLKRVSQIAQAGLKPSILFQTPECWVSRSEPPGQASIPLPLLSSNKVSEARPLWGKDYPLHVHV